MELGELSGANLYAQRAIEDAASANVEKLRETARKTNAAQTDEELMGACREFEAYFMEQVYKAMWKTVDVFSKDKTQDQSTGNLVEFFKGNTLQTFCKDTTKTQSFGLAQMLYDSMKRAYDIPPAEDTATEENAAAGTQTDAPGAS